MNEHYLEELIQNISTISHQGKIIPLKYTGVCKTGAYTVAFEMANPESSEFYYLKINQKGDEAADETRVLSKIGQFFKNEALTEPDPTKRIGYPPIPLVLTDDPQKFNSEFSGLFDAQNYRLQLQTAALGMQAEKQLPETLPERMAILLQFARLLRICAKNEVAYVDIKPLEHLFWTSQNGSMRITLIDWGNARIEPDISLIVDDLRKFCLSIPEVIYGKKILDLQNKGKLTYPIQKEIRKALLPLLANYSFNGDLAPLSREFAVILGDLLTGAPNALRIRSRCIEIWDMLIHDLEETMLQLQSQKSADAASIDELNHAAEMELNLGRGMSQKDITTALHSRRLSLSWHPAWLVAALRFTQTWYGRIDLIPHSEFDEAIRLIGNHDIAGALNQYRQISDIISQKLAQSENYPDLRHHIRSFLNTLGNVLESWNILIRYQNKQLMESEFLSELNTSQLRVSDPVLSELYQNIRNRSNGTPVETPQAEEPKKAPEKKPTREVNSNEDNPLLEAALRSARGLKMEFDRTDNFFVLQKMGFFQRLNEFCLNQNAMEDSEVLRIMQSIFLEIYNKVNVWCTSIRPEKYFVLDEIVNSIDWIRNLSPVIFTYPLTYDGQTDSLGSFIKARLSDTFQSLYYALAGEQTQGEPPEIPAKITQSKTLRKRLDTENLAYIRSLIDRGEFESANQIINLHYSEAPFIFDQLNNEITGKRKDQADQKTIAVINAVLNDLSSGNTTLETTRCLNSPKSAAIISERFITYKNRSTQLFDLQDELNRTRNLIQDLRKTVAASRIMTISSLAAAGISIILLIVLLTSVMTKNIVTEKNIGQLATAQANYRMTDQVIVDELRATAAIAMIRPTDTPPTMIPTPAMIMMEEIIPEIPESSPTPALSPADARLESMLNKAVTYDISGAVKLFNTENLDAEAGSILNYAQGVTGRLISYTDRAVNIQSEFNIGRSQISSANNIDVQQSTYIRTFSTTASETTVIFVLQKPLKLVQPAVDCTTGTQSFCHGTISLWFDRAAIENSLR